ncbi:ead/Ea22-like family protein [Raoultella ornithinolytica]|uniref:ead/Ea22-like family protein n=1 Tax=Raoultella ornithinolytica TaxID=54291 RepID=UPI00234FF186|nr:ead/Ea22-like family protein [Raoultella ornithinolytica]MDC7940312.1 ead/Ea22-like family protein [Raoultella ornithinolytica]
MTTDITELAQSLKAAAEKATPGPWRRSSVRFNGITDIANPMEQGSKPHVANASEKRDAEFIALANPSNILALVEALEKAQTQSSKWLEAYHKAVSIGARYEERIAELESQIKFPGVMRCNTCGFSRSHVIVTPGGMLAGESEPEHCPNGCGPLWHETYRRQYNELYDAYKELESRTVKLPLKIERDDADDWFMYKGGRVGGGAAEWYNKALDDVGAELTAAGIKWEAE